MNRGNFILKCPGSGMDWIRIRLLYRFSFPAGERKPFRIIRRMYADGKADVICAYENGGVASFEGVGGSYVLKNSEAFSETKNLDTLINLSANPDYISVYRKSKVISSGGVTTSNFVNISPKPVMSENTVMVPIESVAKEFSVATGLKEDFIRVKKSSSQILEIYKNSPVINYNGKIFLFGVGTST